MGVTLVVHRRTFVSNIRDHNLGEQMGHTTTARRHRSGRVLAALVLSAGLIGAACGGDDDKKTDTTETAAADTTVADTAVATTVPPPTTAAEEQPGAYRKLADAIGSGDPAGAEKAARELLEVANARLLAGLEKPGDGGR